MWPKQCAKCKGYIGHRERYSKVWHGTTQYYHINCPSPAQTTLWDGGDPTEAIIYGVTVGYGGVRDHETPPNYDWLKANASTLLLEEIMSGVIEPPLEV